MTKREELAWELYCEETKNSLDVRDYWEQLPKHVQELYLFKTILREDI
jgi:hypothetical protein